tara:strand:+ start:578 stop:1435 length:858 start_codon:yes stop_codon:yes gene_type:complete
MSLDLYKKIIDQVCGYAELVYLSGGLGDPLLHPEFGKMIEYARKNSVRLAVSTNGTMLTKKNIDALLSAQPDFVLLPLDGASKEVVEQIRIGSNFETTMERVENFLIEKENRGLEVPYVNVAMVCMPLNEAEATAVKRKWGSYPAVNSVRLKKFLGLQGAKHVPDESDEEVNNSKSCFLPWRQLAISWEGTVAVCCRDMDFKDPMGNVNNSPIEEIWNSEKFIKYRKCLSNGKKSELEICKNCSGIKTNPLTLIGSVIFDDLTIRKILPLLERVALMTGSTVTDY